MNKYELAKKITQLDGLTNEEKASLVELLRSQKKYGLVWEDKPEEIETRLVDELPVLTEVPERAIVSESPDAPNHILIEGDNLEALTALAYTHEGKIDVIYIDPPYNTGNKDFVYNDSFVDKEDGYRHSKWLSFMNKRLQIAKSLLSSGGVIFISIDDNEQAQLKLLCDEIFQPKNCLATLIWDLGSGTSAGHFTRAHEYVLVYCLNRDNIPNFSGGEGIIDDRAIKKKSAKNAEFEYKFKKGTKFEAPDGLEYAGEWGGTEKTKLVSGRFICENQELKEDIVLSACWTQKNQMDSFFSGKETFDSKGQKVLEFYFRENGKLYCRKKRDTINPPTVLRGIATTKQGGAKLKEIFGDVAFDFSKPLNLIEFLLSLRPKESIVLDFFAGSGTTLHATMQLNAEDGGHRQCILVTNNENNICEEVTYERNKRVIQGYTTPKGEAVEGLHDNTLRYYHTNFLSRDKSVKNMRQLVRLATDMLCIKNDVYTEAEFCGKKINPNIARYFDNGQGNRMLVIYEERAIQLLVQLMAQTEDDGIKTMVYVFSPGADPYTDDFEDIAERVKLCALPSAIYEAYKRVLPKRKPKILDEALQEMKAQAEAEANMQQTLDFGENDNMNEEGGEA